VITDENRARKTEKNQMFCNLPAAPLLGKEPQSKNFGLDQVRKHKGG